jgi:uncharacterized repeat protein (TIGR01451 family)
MTQTVAGLEAQMGHVASSRPRRIAVLLLLLLSALLTTTAAAPGLADVGEVLPLPSGITTLDPETVTEDALSPEDPVLSAAAATPFGPNALASVNAVSLPRPQTEPTVTSKPSNRNIMVGGYMDFVDDAHPGVTRSGDGGFSWSAPSGGAILPNPPGFTWGDRMSPTRLAAGDPAVAWGLDDTVYYATLGFQDFRTPPTPDKCDVGGLYVYRSDDDGRTWTLPASGPAIPNTQTIFRDKEYIAVDSNPSSPHAGTVYMVWDDDQYLDCPQDFATNFDVRRVMFSKSIDGGTTWSEPLTLATGCLVTPVPAVGRDGSVYVVWYDCNIGGTPRQLVRKSTDGGATFGAAVSAASGFMDCPNPLRGASFRVNAAFPAIATDPSDANLAYVVWSSCTVEGQADVFLARSTNGGATWSAPLRVNDDAASNPRDQFMPWEIVDDQGDVWVMWGDDRLDTVNDGGHIYDIFAARSIDNGVSFEANVRVTSESSDPDTDFGGGFIGDYFGFAPCGTPIWADTRNGNQDAFAAGLDADANGIADTCTGISPPFGADLSLTKSDSTDPVAVGETLTYFLHLSNAGPEPASAVIVTDNLPATVTFVSATPTQGFCSHSAGTVTCPIGTILSGGGAAIEIEVAAESEGVITNAASASSNTADPDDTNNTDSEDTTVEVAPTGEADLSLTKSDGRDPVRVGKRLTYKLLVKNLGPDIATGVTLTDELPARVTFLSARPRQGTCTHAGGIVTCDLGSLANDERTAVVIRVRPKAPGTLTNTADVSANEADPNAPNNHDTETTTVRAPARLHE